MNDHVTNTVALAGSCAPLWASVSLAGTLQVVSIIWIVLQTSAFLWRTWRGWKHPSHGSDDGLSEH